MTDLVRLSRQTASPHAALCLAAVVRRVVADVQPFCIRRRLALVLEVPGAHPGWGHADDLHRALVNLCLNAIRFTADGGRITLALHPSIDGSDVTVADTGIGIPADLLARLAQPFVTGAPIDTHHSDPIAFRSGGIGLGLAVARAIAEDHGGSLRMESEEGCGTTVHLVVPPISVGAEVEASALIDSSGGRRDNAP